ncbi:MAG TPA: NPCBM/NEW2 domain-containing protein [Pirellulales bacterium]|jgi:hypothetical protein
MGILLLAALLAAPADAQLQTLAGQSVTGALARVAEDKLVLTTPAGEQSFAMKDLLTVTLPNEVKSSDKSAMSVALVDGSTLVVKSFTTKGDQATLQLADGTEAKAQTRAIDSVRYREQTGALVEQWNDIAKLDRPSDVIVLRKNDALDSLTGAIVEATPEFVNFEFDGDVIKVKMSRIEGLLYHRPAKPAKAPAAVCVVNDTSGSRYRAAKLSIDGDKLVIGASAGLEISLPLSEVARLDFSQGNIQYIGDLKPESLVWTPYFGEANDNAARQFYRPRVDRAQEGGGPLRVGGKEFKKGVALHSRTAIVYRLPDGFRTFRAIAGIDDRARPAGDVQLTILGDDRTLFEGRITGNDEPLPLELEVSGVNRLKIIVDFSEDLDLGDFLDLCEARILK